MPVRAFLTEREMDVPMDRAMTARWTSREALMKWFLRTQVALKQFLHEFKASDTGKQAAYALLDDIFQKNCKVVKQFIQEVEVVVMLDERFIKPLHTAAANLVPDGTKFTFPRSFHT